MKNWFNFNMHIVMIHRILFMIFVPSRIFNAPIWNMFKCKFFYQSASNTNKSIRVSEEGFNLFVKRLGRFAYI